ITAYSRSLRFDQPAYLRLHNLARKESNSNDDEDKLRRSGRRLSEGGNGKPPRYAQLYQYATDLRLKNQKHLEQLEAEMYGQMSAKKISNRSEYLVKKKFLEVWDEELSKMCF